MTIEQKDRILKKLAKISNTYAIDCDRKIAEEQGKIIGAEHMMQTISELLSIEYESQGKYEPQESEEEQYSRDCKTCKHSNNGKCAYTEECHECMWESQYEADKESEDK